MTWRGLSRYDIRSKRKFSSETLAPNPQPFASVSADILFLKGRLLTRRYDMHFGASFALKTLV
jgi:hypothetical protein